MSIFYIVKFCKSQTFDIVPYNWVKNNKCSWPNHLKNSDVQNLVKMKKDPEKNWNLYDVEILKAKGKNYCLIEKFIGTFYFQYIY